MKYALVTGSAGLVGSEAVKFFSEKGYEVIGIDNDMRAYFFGKEASTDWNRKELEKHIRSYHHIAADIRDNEAIEKIFQKYPFGIIIHTAAQPSHDWAVKEPMTDFGVNATATLIMLENTRKYAPDASFIFTSTNKVYGALPNTLPLEEKPKRYELPNDHHYYKGIDESMGIDQTIHSIFGASKVSADVMVQEYGKYFGLKTVSFRCGCITGPAHAGAKLHGFLNYLIKCIATGKKYTIYGYKGKQVRDNIHSYDLVNMFWNYHQHPHPGEVYNAGGGRHSNISMLEAIEQIEHLTGKKAIYEYSETNRIGDHMWYISDVSKFRKHYPSWEYRYSGKDIVKEMCTSGHF